jgi:hypothetical protein
MKLSIVCVLACTSLCAQTVTMPAPVVAASTTSVFIGLGGEYNHYSTPAFAATMLELGVCGSKICSVSTLEMQQRVATVRTGFSWEAKKTGRFAFIVTMDAGATFGAIQATAAQATSDIALGNVGGGARIRVDLGGASVLGHVIPKGFGLMVGVREAAVAGTSVQPEFMGSMNFAWGSGK